MSVDGLCRLWGWCDSCLSLECRWKLAISAQPHTLGWVLRTFFDMMFQCSWGDRKSAPAKIRLGFCSVNKFRLSIIVCMSTLINVCMSRQKFQSHIYTTWHKLTNKWYMGNQFYSHDSNWLFSTLLRRHCNTFHLTTHDSHAIWSRGTPARGIPRTTCSLTRAQLHSTEQNRTQVCAEKMVWKTLMLQRQTIFSPFNISLTWRRQSLHYVHLLLINAYW